ncbi:MAG TPA: tetratricopeptide repeat protein, partial [Gemmataceae bacterium]|nr:tetratricopeptide repeat protein [Gemmataceae bacterium]
MLPSALLSVVVLGAAAPEADSADELIRRAKAALMKGQVDEAAALAARAVEREPKNAGAWLFRGTLNAARRKQKEAVADFSKAIQLNPKLAEAYDRRGSEHFKLGQIDKSLADFDRFLELRPDEKPGHWRRGITLYYAGKFDEGRKQFEAYEQKDTNDVENAVWHYVCYARVVGPE